MSKVEDTKKSESSSQAEQKEKNLLEHKTLRSKTRASMTRIKTFVTQKGDGLTLAELECRLGILESYFKQLLSVQAAIDKMCPEEDEESIKNEIEELYCTIKAKILNLMEPFKTPVGDDLNRSIVTLGTAINASHPSKVEIPKFSGPALSAVSMLETQAQNYTKALQILKERFDSKNLIFKEHIVELFNLRNVKKDNPTDLRSIVDSVNAHFSAMQSIGNFEEIANGLVIYLVSTKLDEVSLRKYEESIDYSELCSWQDCAKILSRRCQNLEVKDASISIQYDSNFGRFRSKSQSGKKTSAASLTTTTSERICWFCKLKNHLIQDCFRFKKLSVIDRFKETKKLSLCLNCLEKGHAVKNCKMKKCGACGDPHHDLLHRFVPQLSQTPPTPSSSASGIVSTPSTSSTPPLFASLLGSKCNASSSQVVLGTAVVKIRDGAGKYHHARALLDSASQLNFVTERMAQKLRIKRNNHYMEVNGIGGVSAIVRHKFDANIKSRLSGFETDLEFLVIPSITGCQPSFKIDIAGWNIPQNCTLADPWFNEPAAVDLLIGTDCFFDLLSVGQIKLGDNLPLLQKTLLGWMVVGKVSAFSSQAHNLSCNIVAQSPGGKQLNELVEKFWLMEEKELQISTITEEELKCEQCFVDSVQRSTEGRFFVKYPFKCDTRVLGNSFEIARKRFFNLEKRLLKNEDLKLQYVNFMDEYHQMGHMEEVLDKDLSKVRYYSPHQAVFRPDSSTTKCRVVFDCSCKTSSNISLNEILGKGPVIQDDLFSIIFRFRNYKYALTGDISKMYRQILVKPEDTFFQCILWRKNITEELKTYRLKTVTYGTTSAPFLATRCLKYLAEENLSKFPKAAEVIDSDFYMDDLITGADEISDLQKIRQDVTNILNSAKFELRKWFSNAETIMAEIPEDECEKLLRINDTDIIKTLGLIWNPKSDELHYFAPETVGSKTLTKRIVLSQTAQLFDPLGLINPIVVRAKIFLQELWKLKLKWDDSLPVAYHTLWLSYLEQLQLLNTVKIPRFVFGNSKLINIELHGFADASLKAYGCCMYLRSVDNKGVVTVNLVAAKSRVAPVASRTLPQLELCAAVLLVELWLKIKVNVKKSINKTFFWTDSSIVLCWLSGLPSSWKTFVANRVAKIQRNVGKDAEWLHVGTKDNPADIISRGASIADLKSSIWFKGPKFLEKSSQSWPKCQQADPIECQEERREVKIILIANTTPDFTKNFEKFNFTKTRRCIAYVIRFIEKLKCRLKNKNGDVAKNMSYIQCTSETEMLTTNELDEALIRIVWAIQQKEFKEDVSYLEKFDEVSKKSCIKNLNPFLHEYMGVKIIRVGGRLKNADLPFQVKYPIILPKSNCFVKNIVVELHRKNLHAGPTALMGLIRQQFWIINARRLAQSVVHHCVHCFKYRPKLHNQLMGDLPKNRISEAKAFVRCGVDFFGPLLVTTRVRGKIPSKVYGAVFVCFATKAVHLEIVSDLSSKAFIASLKRFVGRRGRPQIIYCDNGTNFVGARRELEELREKFLSQQTSHLITSWCSDEGIQFSHIPPRAPHFGGLWEAAVKAAKNLLIRTVGKQNLTYEELNTIVIQVESLLNSRPISPMSSDPSDLEALTPGHFLVFGPLTSIVEPSEKLSSLSYTNRWKYITEVQQHIWTRWQKEYVLNLQTRKKWLSATTEVKLGTLVLVAEDNIPPQHWLLGRIMSTIKGRDGHVRVVEIQTKNGVIKRPVTKTAPIPLENEN